MRRKKNRSHSRGVALCSGVPTWAPLRATPHSVELVRCRNKEKPVTSKQIAIMERKIKLVLSRLSLKTGGGASCLRLHSKLKNRVQFLFSIPTFTYLLPLPEPSRTRLLLQLNLTVRKQLIPEKKKKCRKFQGLQNEVSCNYVLLFPFLNNIQRLRWSRGSVLAFGTQVRGYKPGRSRRIFKGK